MNIIFELNKIELKKLLEGKIITEEYQDENSYFKRTSYYDSNYGCIITSGVRILKDKISTTFTSFHDKNGNCIPAGRFLS